MQRALAIATHTGPSPGRIPLLAPTACPPRRVQGCCSSGSSNGIVFEPQPPPRTVLYAQRALATATHIIQDSRQARLPSSLPTIPFYRFSLAVNPWIVTANLIVFLGLYVTLRTRWRGPSTISKLPLERRSSPAGVVHHVWFISVWQSSFPAKGGFDKAQARVKCLKSRVHIVWVWWWICRLCCGTPPLLPVHLGREYGLLSCSPFSQDVTLEVAPNLTPISGPRFPAPLPPRSRSATAGELMSTPLQGTSGPSGLAGSHPAFGQPAVRGTIPRRT